MRTRPHRIRKPERRHILTAILVTLLVLLLGIFYAFRPQEGHSVEVSFADPSQGMEIVPASCASPPPTAPSNGAGYQLSNGVNNAEVAAQGYNFCVTNSGGPSYFVPINSATEVQKFYNAIPGLSGVSQTTN